MIPAQVISLIPLLGTTFDGELVAARDAMTRKLKAVGLDWHDIARALEGASIEMAARAPTRAPPGPASWAAGSAMSFGDLARACRDHGKGRLSPRERVFVVEMCAKGFGFRPSPRQEGWMANIFDRLNGRAAA